MTLRLSVQSSASGDAVYPLISAGDRLLIGGGAECDLRLPDLATTGVIAELRRTEGADGRWRLLPTGTGAEVLFNGAPLPSGQASSTTMIRETSSPIPAMTSRMLSVSR